MYRRHSRLSTYGEDRPRRTRSPSSHEKTQCPSCGQRQLTTVNVDGELPIAICSKCHQVYGIDDSMDADVMAPLLQDEEFCQDFHITADTCDQCPNNDVNRFVVVEGPHPDRLRVMCMECSSFSDIPLKDCETEELGDDVDETLMAEVLDSVEDDDNASLWHDYDSGCVADSEDNDDVGSYEDAGVDVLPFSCGCGNNEVDCFQKDFDTASGDLSMVTCLACDQQKVVESFFGVECWHCGNSRKELFERHVDDYGRITRLRCFVCKKHLHLPGQPPPRRKAGLESQTSTVPSGVGVGKTKIKDLRHIKRGDHVAWHKWYAIWHHAIVVDVPDGGLALTVIHYDGDVKKLDGHLASVRLETINVNLKNEDFYRIDYPAGDTDRVETVVQRACDRLGEAEYNPFTNNCEHFARWCKTGRAESQQVWEAVNRGGIALHSAATKVTHEVVASGIDGTLRTIGKAGLTGIRQRAGQVFGSKMASGVIRKVKCGSLACTVVINLVIEAAMFANDAFDAYRKYKSGAISGDEFRRVLGERGCEAIGGVVGSAGCGILGQILVPIPILGGIVGSTLGNLLGRWLGAVIGNKVAAVKRKSPKVQLV